MAEGVSKFRMKKGNISESRGIFAYMFKLN